MATGEVEKRFLGQARLVRLLLWKVGETTEVDACLAQALAQKMITADDAAFLQRCMQAEERAREGEAVGDRATPEAVTRLQRCADKLNRADSA